MYAINKLEANTGLPTLCFKKVWKLREVLSAQVNEATSPSRHRKSQLGGGAFPIFVWGYWNLFCKIELKFLNSTVVAGGFEMGCAKSLCFKHIEKKVVEKSAV